jgi:hypothetical protein
MTARETVRRTQRIVGAAAVIRALAWGVAITLALLALRSFASRINTNAATSSSLYQTLALLDGIAVAIVLLWRARRFTDRTEVALWMEGRLPALNYSLITALESSQSEFAAGMERTVDELGVPSRALREVRRPVATAAGALIIALALLYVSPSGAFGRSPLFSSAGRNASTSLRPDAPSRIERIEAQVVPPTYASQRATRLADPSTISALVGSRITIRGRGPATGLTARLESPINVTTDDDQWVASFAIPAKPAALTLRDRGFERVVVLAPIADVAPRIVLNTPQHDTALRTPKLVVQLNATATDDIGLDQGHFEYLITSGSGEIFTARTITTRSVRFGNSRNGSLTATLDLSSLKLSEGDVVSMRAIAQDGNTLSGPGVATSDTRTIRIVRASEYDSLAIEAAAPPPLDSSAVSQRMLIIMAEQLVKAKPKLARPELVKRSTDIAELEDRIRRRVREILNDGEETPVQETPDSAAPTVEEMESPDQINGSQNPDLKAAYGALWEAVRSLRIAEPDAALPPMRVALKALDLARLANRLYLRGTPPKIIVDLNRVRLSGKEKGNSNARSPRSFADSARAALASRFDALVGVIERNPSRAVSDLALLRVDALSALPAFAAALGEASDAIRLGRDATLPLLRARRALTGPPAVTPSLSPWSSGGLQ